MRKCPLAFFPYICTRNPYASIIPMRPNFHQITLADKELVQRYTFLSGRHNCDLSFANLYGWQFLYRTEIAEWNGFLLFRFYVDGHLAYLMPVGEGNWQACMQQLRDDACSMGMPLLILGVSPEMTSLLKQSCGIEFVINENRNHADYVYLRQSLASLAGKKLQPKRNHVNKFRKLNPDYEYRPLTQDLIPVCLRLAEQWAERKSHESTRRSVSSELTTIRRVLERMKELDVTGGTLFVNGRMVAFTYGAPITPDTFDVCVEKADTSVEGSYAAINCEFAAHLPEQYTYINREEDLGIDGLRKAKLSYQPYELLEKHSLWSACTATHPSGEKDVTCHQSHIRWQTRALWKLCFNDSEHFMQLYFSKVYRHELNSYIERNGKIIAALQRLPYTMLFAGQQIPVGYVSGVCTIPEFRGKGIMTDLLEKAHLQMAESGFYCSLLIPAEEKLFDYYTRRGYVACRPSHFERTYILPAENAVPKEHAQNACTYTIIRERHACEVEQITACLRKNMLLRECALLHTEEQISIVLDDLFLADGIVIEARTEENHLKGLILALPDKGATCIMELAAQDPQTAFELQRQAAQALDLEYMPIHRQWNRSAIRILNVPGILKAYAHMHPSLHCTWEITGDDTLPENNGIYRLSEGECIRRSPQSTDCTEDHPTDARFNIQQLADHLFENGGPYLSMMLN